MKIAVAHYPEGAGHATRMLAVGRELEAAGHDIVIGGGGPGARFVELNGYDEFRPATVDYVDSYQNRSLRAATANVPRSVERVQDYRAWLRHEDPDIMVTDDMFASLAAAMTGTPYYKVDHNAGFLYEDRLERAGADWWNRFFLQTAEKFLYPAVWESAAYIPRGAERVPPLALEGNGAADDDIDVLMVPTAHSDDYTRLTQELRDRGRDVTVVGGADWEDVESLQPFIEAASLVVCSGYSTVMEAAVAGTPCLIAPRTSEQRGVARIIAEEGVDGFRTVDDADDLDVDGTPTPMDNGCRTVAETIMADANAA